MSNKYLEMAPEERTYCLKGQTILLRDLCLEDATERYADWLADDDVTRYLEVASSRQSIEELETFIQGMRSNPNIFLMAICDLSGRHIGNIKLGYPVSWQDRRASIGIMIGDQDYWGKGVATEAIGLLVDFAFRELNLHKLMAGCLVNNVGAYKAFANNRFEVEGTIRHHYIIDGKPVDYYSLGLINQDDDVA